MTHILDYADNVIISRYLPGVKEAFIKLNEQVQKVGLRVNK